MKKYLVLVLTTLLLLSGCSFSFTPNQGMVKIPDEPDLVQKKARVVRVIDGDTLILAMGNQQKRVRLLLIDTPESVKPGVSVQPVAKEASDYLKESLTDQDVTYAYDLGNKQDKYGRELCYVFVEGTLVQKDLIERGYGIVRYAEAPNTTYLEELKNAEKIAKEQHFGVWGIDDYVQSKNGDEWFCCKVF
ncbi:TPA_asm: thermonuclease [Listeria innocua]|uniref:Nuclease-like protein n=2 Tax=Listeriaceae TaxID=186820 RepID=D7V1H2_LISGR|nr:thermonuclease family protein [Listeria monocytogenes]EFI82794.1 nuclease-like protein [Listeria grayi DSM 20601]EKD7143357.1 thermonuclease family protein [Listeria innocua]CBV37270.1 thermonuclease [Listeria grayi]EAD4735614.1 thermonuclease [Listeria monocytogenes]EAE8802668.1 thermonuclease [Listeria monocytogenes]